MRDNYFLLSERWCPCCKIGDIHPKLLNMLNVARYKLNDSIDLNSAARCEKHNKLVGGSTTSSHLVYSNLPGDGTYYSLAVDIEIPNIKYRFKLLPILFEVGFKRILIYSSWIHVDIDESKIQEICVRMDK